MIALIKKEKPEDELRDSMEQQMEVFLQDNTVNFIDSLFKTLRNKDYLDGPPKILSKKSEDDDCKYEEGKPDSTTSTPANVSELTSDLKDAEHKFNRKTSEVNIVLSSSHQCFRYISMSFLGGPISKEKPQRS